MAGKGGSRVIGVLVCEQWISFRVFVKGHLLIKGGRGKGILRLVFLNLNNLAEVSQAS